MYRREQFRAFKVLRVGSPWEVLQGRREDKMEEQERDVPGASSPPPRGERITLCSPAMSLVLAEMAQADAAE
jgi:hypothetical protein